MANKNWVLRELEDLQPLIIHLRSIIPKADNSGYSKHQRWQVHEIMKQKFCPEKETKLGMIRSTKLLNTLEEEIYHDDIRKWADDFFEITIPLPNETEEWDY